MLALDWWEAQRLLTVRTKYQGSTETEQTVDRVQGVASTGPSAPLMKWVIGGTEVNR